MALYTGPWRTAFFLALSCTIGGAFIGFAAWPSLSGSRRAALIVGALLWCGLMLAVHGRTIVGHWRDGPPDD